MKILMTGNEAIARGAWEAGINLVSSYPGTPSTEITENMAKYEEVYSEWAPNEKVALEVAIGAAISGGRAMACMKHVGVNVACDPLLTVTYSGVNGGLVLISADDPGMHSSQNEQDNRNIAKLAKMPVLEPTDSQECLDMMKLAFDMSEEYDGPVMMRLTTRVAHSQSLVELGKRADVPVKEYEKKPQKFVMIPANARGRHTVVEDRIKKLTVLANTDKVNKMEINDTKIGVITNGIVYQYVKEALPAASILKLGMTNPLPDALLKEFAGKVEKLYVIEELDPIIEDQCKTLGIEVIGKDLFSLEGEIFTEIIREKILGDTVEKVYQYESNIPMRPPVLCAGCPHRGAFYVFKQMKLNVCGDIGCYTLGCVPPLQAIDTTICMGASIGMAHGMYKVKGQDFARKTIAILGDSTFMHSGITGLVDVVYNKGISTTVIMDNSITAMTGHQQNPLTGTTLMGEATKAIDLVGLVKGIGIDRVTVVDPFDVKGLKEALKTELAADEPSVIITQRPCVLLVKEHEYPCYIDHDRCLKCGLCLKMGCPAISKTKDTPFIDPSQCVGCGLCINICKHGVIRRGDE